MSWKPKAEPLQPIALPTKKELFDQEELDALARRNDELMDETLQLYGEWPSKEYLGKEQRAGWLPGALGCICLVALVIGIFGLAWWLLEKSAA